MDALDQFYKQAGGALIPQHLLNSFIPVTERRDFSPDEDAQIDQGESQWLPPIIQTDATPVQRLLASPSRQGLLAGGLGAALGGGLGMGAGLLAGSPVAAGAAGLGGAALGGGILGSMAYLRRYEANEHLKEMMRRLPPHATKRDLAGEEMMASAIENRFGGSFGESGKYSLDKFALHALNPAITGQIQAGNRARRDQPLTQEPTLNEDEVVQDPTPDALEELLTANAATRRKNLRSKQAAQRTCSTCGATMKGAWCPQCRKFDWAKRGADALGGCNTSDNQTLETCSACGSPHTSGPCPTCALKQAGVAPFAAGFLANCLRAGWSVPQIKTATDQLALQLNDHTVAELRDGLTKLAGEAGMIASLAEDAAPVVGRGLKAVARGAWGGIKSMFTPAAEGAVKAVGSAAEHAAPGVAADAAHAAAPAAEAAAAEARAAMGRAGWSAGSSAAGAGAEAAPGAAAAAAAGASAAPGVAARNTPGLARPAWELAKRTAGGTARLGAGALGGGVVADTTRPDWAEHGRNRLEWDLGGGALGALTTSGFGGESLLAQRLRDAARGSFAGNMAGQGVTYGANKFGYNPFRDINQILTGVGASLGGAASPSWGPRISNFARGTTTALPGLANVQAVPEYVNIAKSIFGRGISATERLTDGNAYRRMGQLVGLAGLTPTAVSTASFLAGHEPPSSVLQLQQQLAAATTPESQAEIVNKIHGPDGKPLYSNYQEAVAGTNREVKDQTRPSIVDRFHSLEKNLDNLTTDHDPVDMVHKILADPENKQKLIDELTKNLGTNDIVAAARNGSFGETGKMLSGVLDFVDKMFTGMGMDAAHMSPLSKLLMLFGGLGLIGGGIGMAAGGGGGSGLGMGLGGAALLGGMMMQGGPLSGSGPTAKKPTQVGSATGFGVNAPAWTPGATATA